MENKKDIIKIINRDAIKYLAAIPMTVGHFISYTEESGIITNKPLWLLLLTQASLLAPPIFFFFIADGFRHTHSRKKYALRLLFFALVTQIPFCLVNFGTLLTTELLLNWNIIFTLFLALMALIVWENEWKLPLRIIAIILIDAVTFLLTSEWMIFGVPIILGLHIFREKPKARFIWFTVCILCVEFILSGFPLFFWKSPAFLSGIFFLLTGYFLTTQCYNGKKGKHPLFAKWFFYIFYPSHLLLIYIAQLLVK